MRRSAASIESQHTSQHTGSHSASVMRCLHTTHLSRLEVMRTQWADVDVGKGSRLWVHRPLWVSRGHLL